MCVCVSLFVFNFSCATKPKLQWTLKGLTGAGREVHVAWAQWAKCLLTLAVWSTLHARSIAIVVCLFKDVCQLPCGSAIKIAAHWQREREQESKRERERDDEPTSWADNSNVIYKRTRLICYSCYTGLQLQPQTECERRWRAQGERLLALGASLWISYNQKRKQRQQKQWGNER